MNNNNPIIDELQNLPNENHVDFEIEIVKIASKSNLNTSTYLQQLEEYLNNKQNDLEMRYKIFYLLNVHYRRIGDISKSGHLFNQFSKEFSHFSLLHHLKSVYLANKGLKQDLIEAYYEAEKSIQKNNNSNNPGVCHNLAFIMINIIDENIESEIFIEKDELISLGIELCRKSIKFRPDHGRYYCTLGRFYNKTNNFKQSKLYFKKAMDIEDSSSKDYALRIINYQSYLSNTLYLESIYKFNNEINNFKAELSEYDTKLHKSMNDLKKSNLEFLGFFAALISFTIGSIQIVNNQTFIDAIQLILIFSASLLCSFGGFGIIINGATKNYRSYVIFFLGLIMIVFVVFIKKFELLGV